MVILVRALFPNAQSSMVVTVGGMIMLVSRLSENASVLISVMPEPMVTLVR
ncbi:MAG: hypothetical protein FWC64_02505 [Treponema sp.]|nr:hypothetical protein [Treponema sp.]